MINIRIAGNTYGPALLTLKSMGYVTELAYTRIERNDEIIYDPNWTATQSGITVSATNPVELLGLVMIAEQRGEDWQIGDGETNPLHTYEDSAKTYDVNGIEVHTKD